MCAHELSGRSVVICVSSVELSRAAHVGLRRVGVGAGAAQELTA